MKKMAYLLLAVLTALAVSVSGLCESLYVDNRETDKIYPERLNLRAEPSKEGAILGLYYTGVEVEVLAEENEAYTKVQVGGMTGYMASEYLITWDEAMKRYGETAGFGDYRAAEVDLTGYWKDSISLLADTDPQAQSYGAIAHGTSVALAGVLDDWAYIRAEMDGEMKMGYVPLDVLTDVGVLKVSVIAGAKADSRTILYDAPNSRGKPVMALKNGTACFNLFGRKEGEWRRVRVGSVSGWIKYTQTASLFDLGDQPRSVVPYYPLQMQTKTDGLLYSAAGDASSPYMTLGKDMRVEVLAETDDYVYVRTMEGGAGAYDCGDFGYILLEDLTLAQVGESIGVAQADNRDVPVIVLEKPEADAPMLGALCSGAQVRIIDYTQTDYVEVALGTLRGYIPKAEIRILTTEDDSESSRIPQRAKTLEDVKLRESPADQAGGEVTVAKDERVYMLGAFGEWAFVQFAAEPGLDVLSRMPDRTGFVRIEKLNAPASTIHLTAFVNTDKVNLRSRASSTEGQIIGKARTGERLRVADYGKSWSVVVTPQGKRGYIMTKYLDFE